MEIWLENMTQTAPFLVYGVVFLLTIVEGPIVSIVAGLLFKLGFFPFIPIFITLIIGDLVGDSIWYFVGSHFGMSFIRRFGKYVGVTEESVEKVKDVFHKQKERILILSKMTNGLGLSMAVLLTAGMVKIPFIKYIYLNAIGEIIWTGMLVAVGYFFGQWYIQIDTWMGRIGFVGIFVFVIIIFLQIKKYFNKKALEMSLE
ncbi:MAG: DedA family protein [Minisyncoccia bacterium]